MSEPKETYLTDNVICPHCFCEMVDDGDIFQAHKDEAEIYCDECDKLFKVYREIDVRYITKKG